MNQSSHSPCGISAPHALPTDGALDRLQSQRGGLTAMEAVKTD